MDFKSDVREGRERERQREAGKEGGREDLCVINLKMWSVELASKDTMSLLPEVHC